MKTPQLKELKRLNSSLKVTADETYRRVLGVAVKQYCRRTGDHTPLGYLRGKRFDLLYRWADALVSGTVYPDAATHFAAHQLAALIRKYPWSSSDVLLDPEAAALRSFSAAEHRCKWMNRWARAVYRRDGDRVDRELRAVRKFIREVIGSRPNLLAIYNQCDLSAGANVGVHGDATNLWRKLSAKSWSVTPSALPYFAAALCHHFHYATRVAKGNGFVQSFYVSENDVKESCELVDYNKIAFVPKTAKTHRSIAVEPLGNGFLQKGVDNELRRRLKRVGIDLSDQSLNSRLAREGSADSSDEGFCTIDLSSASDSIAIEVVRLLLPPAWFDFLNRIRSPSYLLPNGEKHRYEKFCSMGNGFCFPLESLIFAACAKAVSQGVGGADWAVYGDDIVVRRKAFEGVISLLKRLGFKPNAKKTFSTGPFRESCGGNWYQNEDVTPFTLDYKLDNLSSYFKAVNLMRRNERTSWFFREVVSLLIKRIPQSFRFFRPVKGPEDTAIDFRDLQFEPNWRWSTPFQCPKWLELRVRPVKDEFAVPPYGWGLMAAALRGHPSARPFVLRRQVEMRVRWNIVPHRGSKPGVKMSEVVITHPDVGNTP